MNSDRTGLSLLHRLRARGAEAVAWTRRAASTFVIDGGRVFSRRVREAILTVVSVAFIIWVFKLLNNEHLYDKLGFDEQFFVWTGWSVRKGLVPYKDFSEWKGPFIFLTHALALTLHGFRDLKFRWFFFYFPLASLLALYAAMLSRKIDKLGALALILAIIHLFVGHQFHDTALSDSESIGLTYYFFGVACVIARTRLGDKLRALGVGLLAACAFSKEPYMPTVGITWVACFFLDVNWSALSGDVKRYLKATAIGGGVVALGLGLYLVPTGGITWYVRLLLSYRRIYKDPQHSYCVMFGRFVPTDTVSDLLQQWERIRLDFFNLSRLGYLLPFAALFLLYVPRRSLMLALTSLLAVAAGLWAVTASKCQWGHYYIMSMAGLFFCLVIGLDGLARRFASFSVNRVAGWVLLAGMLALILPRVDNERSRTEPRPIPNAYEESIPGVLEFIEKNTKPTDRIFTLGPPGLYVQANRLHATRESGHVDAVIYGYPGNTDEERFAGLKEQLEKNMPKVIVLDPAYEGYRQKHIDLLITPFVKKYGYKKQGDRYWVRPN